MATSHHTVLTEAPKIKQLLSHDDSLWAIGEDGMLYIVVEHPTEADKMVWQRAAVELMTCSCKEL